MPTNNSPEKFTLQTTLDKLFSDLDDHDPDTEEYSLIAAKVEQLYKLKEVDAKVTSAKHVAASAWAAVGANLLGIAMIVGHEKAHVVGSKALNFIMKLK